MCSSPKFENPNRIEVLQLEIIDENIELTGRDKLTCLNVYLGEDDN
jgi:hypothetical protein